MNKELEERMKLLKRGVKHGDIYGTPPSTKKKKKGKKTKVTQRQLYDITLPNFQLHLYSLICQINGIDENIYLFKSSSKEVVLNGNMKIDKKFKKLSKLDWEKPANIDSLTFRGRFTTLLLHRMVRNSHRIIKKIYKESGNNKKYQSYNVYLDEIIYQVTLFTTTFLSANLNYWRPLKTIIELIMLSEDDDIDIIDKVEGTRDLLLLQKKKQNYGDGIIMNNLTKTAYALTTGSIDVKHTPSYDEHLSKRDNAKIANQIGILGYAILRWRRKHSFSLLHRIFYAAKPEVWSRFDEINNMPELLLGTYSIELVKLVMGDYSIGTMIDKYI